MNASLHTFVVPLETYPGVFPVPVDQRIPFARETGENAVARTRRNPAERRVAARWNLFMSEARVIWLHHNSRFEHYKAMHLKPMREQTRPYSHSCGSSSFVRFFP